jgi:molybdate transport system permease protein
VADLDLGPVWLTLRLAGVTVALLLLVGTPLAWWLAHTRTRAKPLIEALTALPLVLPPTVIGFYLLVLFAPAGVLGEPWLRLTGQTLTFSFSGLVLASMIYSLPFVVQPLQGAFEAVGRGPLEAAATIAIYEQVETLQYAQAHVLAGGLLVFSFAVLVLVYALNRRFPVHAA